ncbi:MULTISPECIES: hypothetical protein [Cupriavidus]
MSPDATHAALRAATLQWVNALTPPERDALLVRVRAVQGWVDDFAKALGKRRAPQVRLTLDYLYYAPWRNRICVPARILMQAQERLLRIAVAHECGHFKRRWASLLSRSAFSRMGEEVLADRVAMQLTDASLDELDAAVREIARFEHGWDAATTGEYLALRLQRLRAGAP